MLNLIRMDFYRLKHSNAFITMLILTAATAFLQILALWYFSDVLLKGLGDSDEIIIGYGLSSLGINILGGKELGEILSFCMSGFFPIMYSVLLTGIFCGAEYKNGFLKNISGLYPSRSKLIISKFAVIGFQTFIIFTVYAVAVILFSVIFWFGNCRIDNFPQILGFIFVKMLLCFTLSALVQFFCVLTRGGALGITMGMLISCGVFGIFGTGLNIMVAMATRSTGFDIFYFTIKGMADKMKFDAPGKDMLWGILVAVVYTTLFTFFSILLMKKKEIR